MPGSTKIEWTEATWNPTSGCTKVSPGCDNCYAERITERFHGRGSFTEVTLHPERLETPLRWRKPRMVFVNSMFDLFHPQVPDEFVARVFAVMHDAEQHTFQILTKRHGRAHALLNDPDFYDRFVGELAELRAAWQGYANPAPTWPLRNVWLGVSVETQKWADVRIPALLDTPAAVRFLSAEPLLGPVDLDGPADVNGHRASPSYWLTGRPGWVPEGVTSTGMTVEGLGIGPSIDWVIAGGESGPNARPMHPDWARLLRDQCVSARVPYFFKQHGEWWPGIPSDEAYLRRVRQHNWPDGEHTSYRVGKSRAGRKLDGETWGQFPDTGDTVGA